jgi:hypothetical protein
MGNIILPLFEFGTEHIKLSEGVPRISTVVSV